MINLVSVFSGAGGLDYAFETTREFQTRIAVEFQPEFADSLEGNRKLGTFRSMTVLREDVSSIDPVELSSMLPKNGPLGLIGGPPCEAFSSMGRRAGTRDERGRLIFEFVRLLRGLQASFFVLENVPDVAKVQGGALLNQLLASFRGLGFNVAWQVLNAADYGSATTRKRLFVVGVREKCTYSFPEPTHGESVQGSLLEPSRLPWRTVRDAIGDLPTPAVKAPGRPFAHFLVKHTAVVEKRFASLEPGSYDNVRKRSRLCWDRPSPSLVAGNLSGTRFHIHPGEHRELTKREAARLQGFPDDFCFSGGWDCVAKQIANAVPIPLGSSIAASLAHQLRAK